jgi:serralysin
LLVGNAGDDVLDGGPGCDHIFAGPGNDTVEGGPGWSWWWTRPHAWRRAQAPRHAYAWGRVCERLHGGVGNDVVNGGAGREFISGGRDDDTLDEVAERTSCSPTRAAITPTAATATTSSGRCRART